MTREEAIKLIDTHTVCFYNEIDSPTLQALHLAIEALSEETPTNTSTKSTNISTDASTDRPQGEWVGFGECSVCGKQADDFIEGWVDGLEYLPNFCPNCGARMTPLDGERREK